MLLSPKWERMWKRGEENDTYCACAELGMTITTLPSPQKWNRCTGLRCLVDRRRTCCESSAGPAVVRRGGLRGSVLLSGVWAVAEVLSGAAASKGVVPLAAALGPGVWLVPGPPAAVSLTGYLGDESERRRTWSTCRLTMALGVSTVTIRAPVVDLTRPGIHFSPCP